jgi:hypothetical protein
MRRNLPAAAQISRSLVSSLSLTLLVNEVITSTALRSPQKSWTSFIHSNSGIMVLTHETSPPSLSVWLKGVTNVFPTRLWSLSIGRFMARLLFGGVMLVVICVATTRKFGIFLERG